MIQRARNIASRLRALFMATGRDSPHTHACQDHRLCRMRSIKPQPFAALLALSRIAARICSTERHSKAQRIQSLRKIGDIDRLSPERWVRVDFGNRVVNELGEGGIQPRPIGFPDDSYVRRRVEPLDHVLQFRAIPRLRGRAPLPPMKPESIECRTVQLRCLIYGDL